MKNITINLDTVDSLVKKGENFVFKKEAEAEIIKLLKLRDLLDEKIKEVKVGIEKAGKSIDPSFKGVIGENLRATYRVFGERYTYDKNIEQPKKIIFECDICGYTQNTNYYT